MNRAPPIERFHARPLVSHDAVRTGTETFELRAISVDVREQQDVLDQIAVCGIRPMALRPCSRGGDYGDGVLRLPVAAYEIVGVVTLHLAIRTRFAPAPGARFAALLSGYCVLRL